MASATLNQELDSLFLKGLRLLHSSEPDAEEQLQQLWKQAVVDKYGSERTPTSVLHKITETAAVKRENPDVTSDAVVEAKRPKLESSTIPPSALTSSQNFASADAKDSSGDEASPLEILNTDNICRKCKTSTSSASDSLVECVECHKHYHQTCHFPPISDMDLSDPRFVWYCSSCDPNITTTTTDKTKAGHSSSTSSIKSGNSSKGLASTSKSSRIHSTNKTSTQGSISSTNSKIMDSNSKDIGGSNSSSTPEKKGHMMKKRSLRKPDKKKSSK